MVSLASRQLTLMSSCVAETVNALVAGSYWT